MSELQNPPEVLLHGGPQGGKVVSLPPGGRITYVRKLGDGRELHALYEVRQMFFMGEKEVISAELEGRGT